LRLPRRGHPAAPASNAIHIDACRPKIVSQAPAERPRVPTITVGLRPHPSTPAAAAATGGNPAPEAPPPSPVGMLLTTMYATPDGGAVFEFHLDDSRPAELRIPAPAAPGPADGLWQHTCFEVFVACDRSAAYCEFNFSPSTCWAAYRFTGYRAGMTGIEGQAAPTIALRREACALLLDVHVDVAEASGLLDCATLRCGVAAVIEDVSGRLSYWALAHPHPRPDFHASEGFLLSLSEAPP
jgi:hypothetical protein